MSAFKKYEIMWVCFVSWQQSCKIFAHEGIIWSKKTPLFRTFLLNLRCFQGFWMPPVRISPPSGPVRLGWHSGRSFGEKRAGNMGEVCMMAKRPTPGPFPSTAFQREAFEPASQSSNLPEEGFLSSPWVRGHRRQTRRKLLRFPRGKNLISKNKFHPKKWICSDGRNFKFLGRFNPSSRRDGSMGGGWAGSQKKEPVPKKVPSKKKPIQLRFFMPRISFGNFSWR